MSFFKKMSRLVSPPPDANVHWVYVNCNRCGEKLRGRVNLSNDLSINYAGKGKDTYFCRKVIMGSGQCFQRVEVELAFDKNRKLINKEIQGGGFISEEEFADNLSPKP